MSSSQSEERTMFFTREKNDTSSRIANGIFSVWENDTLSKNHRNLRVSRQEGREGLFSNAPVRTAYSQEYHFENNNLRKIQEAGGRGKQRVLFGIRK